MNMFVRMWAGHNWLTTIHGGYECFVAYLGKVGEPMTLNGFPWRES